MIKTKLKQTIEGLALLNRDAKFPQFLEGKILTWILAELRKMEDSEDPVDLSDLARQFISDSDAHNKTRKARSRRNLRTASEKATELEATLGLLAEAKSETDHLNSQLEAAYKDQGKQLETTQGALAEEQKFNLSQQRASHGYNISLAMIGLLGFILIVLGLGFAASLLILLYRPETGDDIALAVLRVLKDAAILLFGLASGFMLNKSNQTKQRPSDCGAGEKKK